MDYLQYWKHLCMLAGISNSFKPYYKWITFNTKLKAYGDIVDILSFKPYYKWITFNTLLLFSFRFRNF